MEELKSLLSELDQYVKDVEARGETLENTVAAVVKSHLQAAKATVVKEAESVLS